MIIGSMTFTKEMLQLKEDLIKMGYSVDVPYDAEYHLEDEGAIDDLERNYRYCIEQDVVWKGFQQVAEADAVLALNLPKNGIAGYIGTSTLMEMGIAHWLKKKIFLLHEPPDHNAYRWAHEARIVCTKVLHGDLSEISSELNL